MPRFSLLLVLFVALTGTGSSQGIAPPPVFVLHGPAIVAFFPPAPQSGPDASDGADEALSDFEFYADRVRVPLQKAGIRIEMVFAP